VSPRYLLIDGVFNAQLL